MPEPPPDRITQLVRRLGSGDPWETRSHFFAVAARAGPA